MKLINTLNDSELDELNNFTTNLKETMDLKELEQTFYNNDVSLRYTKFDTLQEFIDNIEKIETTSTGFKIIGKNGVEYTYHDSSGALYVV